MGWTWFSGLGRWLPTERSRDRIRAEWNVREARLLHWKKINESSQIWLLTWRKLVVVPDVESVSEKSPVEEDVGEEEDGDDDDQVQELAQDEAPEVNAKPAVYVFREVLKKDGFFENYFNFIFSHHLHKSIF